jgi:putative FmdB family regulatory protein
MPLYDLNCKNCGADTTRFIKLQDLEEYQECDVCSGELHRVISAPFIQVSDIGYTCPITDKWVGSKQEHRNNLDRHDCRLLERGEHEHNETVKQRANAEFEKVIEQSVEKEILSMPTEKVERLAKEVEAGVDISIDRM